MGFAGGLIAAFVLRWSILDVNFRFGNFARAVLLFAKTMLWWGIIGGVIGIGVGVIVGRVWQHFHMKLRHQREVAAQQAAAAAAAASSESAAATGAGPSALVSPVRARTGDISALRFDDAPIPAEAYLALTARVWPKAHDPQRGAAALLRTQNVGAWDGSRLIGLVRVLTDGYFTATVPEIIVDPEYRGRGVGRELMNRALALAPGNRMTIIPTEDSVGFFQRLRCDLAPMGFVMRSPALPSADRPA